LRGFACNDLFDEFTQNNGCFDLQPASTQVGWHMTVRSNRGRQLIHLSDQERKQLADWFEELEEVAWDRQMEQDFAPGGRGVSIFWRRSIVKSIPEFHLAGSRAAPAR